MKVSTYAIIGISALLLLGVVISDGARTGSVFQTGPSSSGGSISQGESAGSTLRSMNVLGSFDRCNDKDLDYCNYNRFENGWAEAEAQLEVNSIDVVEEVNGVKYVEPGTRLKFACGEPRPNQDISHNTYVWEEASPDYQWPLTSNKPVPASDRAPAATQVGNEGSIDVSFSSPTEITLSCVGYKIFNDDAAAAVSNFEYAALAEAPDSDNDGVYNFDDDCPNQAGSSTADGCPDRDGDGVRDSEDEFPNDSDCQEDSDGDRVCDSKDQFPNDPQRQFDQDNDGVADSFDECPTQGDEGLGVKQNGCPIIDSDNDGVEDSSDQCRNTPDQAEVDAQGCPVDSDGDGVPNYQDECPTQGSSEIGVDAQGCPVEDDDLDGVTNSADECENTWGSKINGCPTVLDSIINTIGLRGVLQ